jgi:hypothetical protein
MMLDTFEVGFHRFGEIEVEDFFNPRNVYALREMVAYYAAIGYCPENVLAMIAVVDYAKTPSIGKLNFIFANFIDEKAKYQVNINASTRHALNDARGKLLRPDSGTRHPGGRRGNVAIPIPPSEFFRIYGLYSNLLIDIGEEYVRFSVKFVREDKGSLYVKHVNVSGNSMVKEVKDFLVNMLNSGFNISPKIMRLDS